MNADELRDYKREWMRSYRAAHPGPGPRAAGWHHTPETMAKIAAIRRGELEPRHGNADDKLDRPAEEIVAYARLGERDGRFLRLLRASGRDYDGNKLKPLSRGKGNGGGSTSSGNAAEPAGPAGRLAQQPASQLRR